MFNPAAVASDQYVDSNREKKDGSPNPRQALAIARFRSPNFLAAHQTECRFAPASATPSFALTLKLSSGVVMGFVLTLVVAALCTLLHPYLAYLPCGVYALIQLIKINAAFRE